MNGKAFFAAVFGMLFLLPAVQAAVQIQSYTITPTTLKPGMTGTINLVLNNPSATEFITGAYLDARASGVNFVPQMKIGDLGAQGSTNVAIPFTVSETGTPGIIPVTLELTYTSSVASGSNYKSFSIPLTIATTTLLKVTDVTMSADTIYPGDSFTIRAVIENSGGPVKNAVLSYSSAAAYTFDGTTKIDVGNIGSGERKAISIPALAGNSITAGYYSVPFTLAFDDAVTAGNSETLYFGPITAVQDYAKYAISAEAENAVPGGQGNFIIMIRNTGSNELRNFKVALPQESEFFTPLDFTEKTVESIKPGETKEVSFSVGIGTNIAAQVYALPLTLSYQSKSGSETETKSVGVRVGGAPSLSAYISTNPPVMTNDNKLYSVSVQISNTGNSAVRALSVKVSSGQLEILSPADAFIGTLALDDYSTVQYDAVVKKGVQPGKYALQVELSYKDSYNQPHADKKAVQYEIYPPEVALLASKQNGGNPLTTIIIVAIVLAVVYFGYKRFFKSGISQKLKMK